jgi:Holliday junction DNA helicase RuvA
MIAFLHGKLADATPTNVIVDVNGVGYSVFIPLSSYDKLPAKGGEVKLLTYHHVNAQDGTQQLFGFATAEEREMFLLLISISGIGPKLACNILSSASITGLRDAIAAGDTKTLSTLRGIGRKTAERLVVELKDKVGVAATKSGALIDQRLTDAVLALVSLGYKQMDAHKLTLLAAEKLGAKASVEELVRAALRSGS